MVTVQERGCGCCYLDAPDSVRRRQKTQTLWLTLGFLTLLFCVELGTSLWSYSLSLLADTEHLLSDIAALGLTLTANWLAAQPAADRATFGHHRVEVLAALVNGLSLLAIATLIAWEAICRFSSPEPLLGLPMLIGAVVGLLVNSLNLTLLHQHSHTDLNLRGVFLHVFADVVSCVSVILAALAVYLLNWLWVDAGVSLFVAGLIGFSAIPLIQESLEVLMEYAPRSIDSAEVAATLESFTEVERVRKLHIWTITSGQVVLCAALTVKSLNAEQRDQLLQQLNFHLEQKFDINQPILQLTSRSYRESVDLHPLFSRNLVNLLFNDIEKNE